MIHIWFSFDSAFHNLWHELLSLDSAYALLHGLHQCRYCTSEGLQGSSTHRSQIKNHKINMHTTPDIVMPAQSSPRLFFGLAQQALELTGSGSGIGEFAALQQCLFGHTQITEE